MVFFLEHDHISMQEIFACMILFIGQDHALFLTAIERFWNDAYIAAYFSAMYKLYWRIGQFTVDQCSYLFHGLNNLVNNHPAGIEQTGRLAFHGFRRQGKAINTR